MFTVAENREYKETESKYFVQNSLNSVVSSFVGITQYIISISKYVILSKSLGINNFIETVFVSLGMFFHFFEKRLFRYENDDKKSKTKRSFL